jgi:hypothetical protein
MNRASHRTSPVWRTALSAEVTRNLHTQRRAYLPSLHCGSGTVIRFEEGDSNSDGLSVVIAQLVLSGETVWYCFLQRSESTRPVRNGTYDPPSFPCGPLSP